MQSWRVVEVVVRQRRHVLDPIVITKTLGGWRYSEGEEYRGVIAHTHIQSGRGKSMNCERRGSIEQITIRANDSTICTTHSTYGHPKARCWSHIASAEDRHSTQPTCYPIPPTRSHSRKKKNDTTDGRFWIFPPDFGYIRGVVDEATKIYPGFPISHPKI